MSTLKSVGAIITGFLTVVVLSVATDKILEAASVFPPATDTGLFVTWMLVFAFAYRSVYAVAGGYIAAKLAPNNPMKHVTALGILGIMGGTAGVVAGWNLSEHWYPIALAVTAFPLTWIGGKLQTR